MLPFILLSFLSGSLPFSVWIGSLALKTDIRTYGDGNPGGTNVWRAGGRTWALIAILLDGLKGAIPVWLGVNWLGFEGWLQVPLVLAPVLGHAYSPLLRGHGGKALAVTFGVWAGLTIWVVPTILGLCLLAGVRITDRAGWVVSAGMAVVTAFYLLIQPNIVLSTAALFNGLLLAWKYRMEY